MTPLDEMAEREMGGSTPSDHGRSPQGGRPEEFEPAGGPTDDPLTRNLKKVYQQVAEEPIPDDWLKLLDQLDAKAPGGDHG